MTIEPEGERQQLQLLHQLDQARAQLSQAAEEGLKFAGLLALAKDEPVTCGHLGAALATIVGIQKSAERVHSLELMDALGGILGERRE